MSRRKTTMVRMYRDDRNEIKSVFPNVKMADFLHITLRKNTPLQIEAALRKRKK